MYRGQMFPHPLSRADEKEGQIRMMLQRPVLG
jgi:hypothetical protein